MGCTSSKILTRSISYQEEINQKFSRRSIGLEEILSSSNGGDQLLFLLSAANAASKRIKAATVSEDTETKFESSDLKPNNTEKPEVIRDHSVEKTNLETINAWELLAGLEEDKEFKQDRHLTPVKDSLAATVTSNVGFEHTRSFHTVEDYYALLAETEFSDEKHRKMPESATQLVEEAESSIREQVVTTSVKIDIVSSELEPIEDDQNVVIGSSNNLRRNRSSKRMDMAKELQPLVVPTPFNFAKSVSLKDWLLQGGQLVSPGSYVTPKFGSYAGNKEEENSSRVAAHDEIEDHVFDPEMIAQFEQALKQLNSEEELALRQIIGSMEEDD